VLTAPAAIPPLRTEALYEYVTTKISAAAGVRQLEIPRC
jgi:hypothetical protein